MNKSNIKNQNYDDIRIVIPKDKIHENIEQESFIIKLLKKLNIL
jgi:hypothetical protein